MDDQVIFQIEKQRLTLNEATNKVDFLQSKLMTIEKHLPMMIQEILEFYFDKKLTESLNNTVTKQDLHEALSCKLDTTVFDNFEKRFLSDMR
jgi:hypothetical protein